MKLVWRSRPTTVASSAGNTNPPSISASIAGSEANLAEKPQGLETIPGSKVSVTEKEVTEKERPQPPAKRSFWSWKLSSEKTPLPSSDIEKGEVSSIQARPIRYFAPIYTGFSAGLSVCE